MSSLKKKSSAAETILKRIIAPLSRHKHHEQDLGQFWDSLFGLDVRDIETYRVHAAFKMPGLYYVSGSKVKTQGIGPRHLKKGELVYVRIDKETGCADVEYLIRNQEHVFALTSTEWGTIKLKLTPARLKTRRKNR